MQAQETVELQTVTTAARFLDEQAMQAHGESHCLQQPANCLHGLLITSCMLALQRASKGGLLVGEAAAVNARGRGYVR